MGCLRHATGPVGLQRRQQPAVARAL